ARRYLAAHPGPWSAQPSTAFLQAVGATLVEYHHENAPVERDFWRFTSPGLEGPWLHDLVRRDQVEEVGAFVAPRVHELIARIQAPAPVGRNASVVEWTRWLSDSATFEAWTRSLAAHDDRLAELAAVFSERRLWDRLWVLGARSWDVTPLVAILPDASR